MDSAYTNNYYCLVCLGTEYQYSLKSLFVRMARGKTHASKIKINYKRKNNIHMLQKLKSGIFRGFFS